MTTKRHTYILATVDDDGNDCEYSADSRDYWQAAGNDSLNASLFRTDHPFVTVTGRTVYGWRMLKVDAKVSDLWRLEA